MKFNLEEFSKEEQLAKKQLLNLRGGKEIPTTWHTTSGDAGTDTSDDKTGLAADAVLTKAED
nr:hypothetical protein [uncultured Carboxylicivirga sp.]